MSKCEYCNKEYDNYSHYCDYLKDNIVDFKELLMQSLTQSQTQDNNNELSRSHRTDKSEDE